MNMLSEILALMSEGKIFSQHELAERLHTTPEAVTARLDFMRRTGYLRKICTAKDCGKKCAGCMSESAEQGNFPILWEVTNKSATWECHCALIICVPKHMQNQWVRLVAEL